MPGPPPCLTIRPVRAADALAWERMRERLWPSGSGEHAGEIARYFAGSLPEPVEVLLAIHDGETIGMAELSIRHQAEGCDSDRIAYLEGWFVESGWRRRGVGRRLIAAAIDWGRRQGCRELGSDAEIDNLGSQAAHAALGFEITSRIVTYRLDIGS